MQEHVGLESSASGPDRIQIQHPVKNGQHIFRRAENATNGQVLVPAKNAWEAENALKRALKRLYLYLEVKLLLIKANVTQMESAYLPV